MAKVSAAIDIVPNTPRRMAPSFVYGTRPLLAHAFGCVAYNSKTGWRKGNNPLRVSERRTPVTGIKNDVLV